MSASKKPRPTSDRILSAAADEFARRGYGDTSLRQLMAAARVSTTAFYARFPTKEAVLQELVSKLLVDLEARARVELGRAGNVGEGFDRGADVLTEVLVPNRQVVRIALTEGGASPVVAETLKNLYSTLASLLASNIRSLARRGKVDATNADTVAWSLVGALNMQVIRWAVLGELGDDELAPALRGVARALLPVLDPARCSEARVA